MENSLEAFLYSFEDDSTRQNVITVVFDILSKNTGSKHSRNPREMLPNILFCILLDILANSTLSEQLNYRLRNHPLRYQRNALFGQTAF